MNKLDIETLNEQINICYSNSRNNEKFSLEERGEWLKQAENLRARYIKLQAASFESGIDSQKVRDANKKLASIKQQLSDTQNFMARANFIIRELQALVGILDDVIKFITPNIG